MGRWGYNKEEQDFDSLDLIPSSPPPTNISEDMQISQNAPLQLSSLRLFALHLLAPRKGIFEEMSTPVSYFVSPSFCPTLKRIPLFPIGFLFMNIFILNSQIATIITL